MRKFQNRKKHHVDVDGLAFLQSFLDRVAIDLGDDLTLALPSPFRCLVEKCCRHPCATRHDFHGSQLAGFSRAIHEAECLDLPWEGEEKTVPRTPVRHSVYFHLLQLPQ